MAVILCWLGICCQLSGLELATPLLLHLACCHEAANHASCASGSQDTLHAGMADTQLPLPNTRHLSMACGHRPPRLRLPVGQQQHSRPPRKPRVGARTHPPSTCLHPRSGLPSLLIPDMQRAASVMRARSSSACCLLPAPALQCLAPAEGAAVRACASQYRVSSPAAAALHSLWPAQQAAEPLWGCCSRQQEGRAPWTSCAPTPSSRACARSWPRTPRWWHPCCRHAPAHCHHFLLRRPASCCGRQPDLLLGGVCYPSVDACRRLCT